ncbi:ShlB/FhaC/HecB family hemolysin secretion/activation protein [Sphingomonas parva]|uniref:ShlB/FhaC/HecB family hemolysin secretion/activation protein n=1 Tax=Sphingomonas parva TaxID=2555898 RepID=A0A4Y8ZR43_9SPHN|nr:ShlB/FhaC/HecB family hemolysin secretion/activation protein [Sphingomonas parva]TFI58473.1 ShlB/FhaC/HecB family hemolysin secretion/activation protein [Sphingomonas parva]
MRRIVLIEVSVLAAFAGAASPALAQQNGADRADPSVAEQELREERAVPTTSAEPILRPAEGLRTGSAVTEPILAGAILVEGAEALPQAAFAPVVERYLGRTLSVEELRTLAADIAAVARDAGYGLATAWIPEQRLQNGLLRVRIEEGRIDAVEVNGDGRDAVEPRLTPLADGRPVRTAALERQLLLAGDVAGIRMGKAKLERRGGRNVLVVNATRDRFSGRGGVDNWGSSTSGPVRARVAIDFNRLLRPDDSLTLEALTTPFEPKEFGLIAARYTAALGYSGTEFSVGGYLARSEAGGFLADRDLDGRSSEIEAELRHPLKRSRAGSLWASLDARIRDSEQTREDLLVRDDRLALVSASAFAYRRLGAGRLRARVSLVQGLDLFGASDAGDPLSSRSDADGRFSKLELWAELDQRLAPQLSLVIQSEGQVANGPLLSSEEMGLGGRRFGRAWDYREFSGDRGIAGSVELRKDFPKPVKGVANAQVYAYADAGAVDNYRLGFGGGSLASAGGGVRLRFPPGVWTSLELGVPLTDGYDPSRHRDPRLSFTIDFRF